MSHGISTNKRTTSQAGCLHGNGIAFVCRYYSTTTHQSQKRISLAEAQALLAAGLHIVTVYEDGPTSADYFTYSRGMQDGAAAHGFARGLGQTVGSAIYFAVDYDATNAHTQGPISQYFQGVKDGLEHADGGSAQYAVGVYGSGRVCARIKEHAGLAQYSWLAESHGWAGHGSYTSPNIRQEIANHTLCGLVGGVGGDYEDNFANGDFGAFSTLGASALGGVAGGVAGGDNNGGQMPAAEALIPAVAPLMAAAAPGGGAEAVGGTSGGYVRQVAALAQQQFDQYHQYSENESPLRQQIRRYWEEIGFTFPGVSTAWSAVFVSWIMREAGASAGEFKVSNAHSRFIYWAIQNKRNGTGVFHGYRISDYAPKVGDIIHNNRNHQTLTYDFAAAHQAYESHSAIVVETGSDAVGKYALTVGGNESDTVGKKRVLLDDQGFVRQRAVNPFICVVQNLKT